MVSRSGIVLALTAGMAAAAAPAGAQAPPPAAPKLSITTERVSAHGRHASAVVGQRWRVRIVLRPLLPGEVANVTFSRGARLLRAVQVALRRSRTGRSAFAVVPFRRDRAGRIVVQAGVFATPQLPAIAARPVAVRVRVPSLAPGARGPAVRLLQTRLARLGYVVGARGRYDDRTARAVLAFRKVTGMARVTLAGADVLRRLARGGGAFRVRFPAHGKHVEADLSRQVIALIRGGRVERIYPVSSGAGATPTIRGHFRVYTQTPGYNAKAMYFSSYFIRGYAIHGYASVPVLPASHGCLRVPLADAVPIYRWLRRGDRVDVYA